MTKRVAFRERKTGVMALCFLFCLFGTMVGAQEYGVAAPDTERIRRAYVSAGRVFPQTSFPVSRKRLLELAEGVGLSLGGEGYENGIRSDAFAELAVDASLSGQSSLIQPDAPRDGIDLQRAWAARPPFLRFGGFVESAAGLLIEAEAEVRKEWNGSWFNRTNLPEGSWEMALGLENHILKRGVLSWENDAFRVWLGRDKVHFGPAGFSTLYPSDLLPHLDAGRFQARLGDFTFDYLLGGFHPIKSWEGYDVDTVYQSDPAKRKFGFWNEEKPTAIYLGVHRFGYETDAFRLAFGEVVMYARRYDVLATNDILPIATWHGLDLIPDNMVLILEAGMTPIPGLTFNFMGGLDDIGGQDFGIADGAAPTIWACVGDAEAVVSLGNAVVDVRVEGGYTHYLWGNFDAVVTNDGGALGDPMPFARHIARYEIDSTQPGGGMILPLTSPYGPGAVWGKGEVRVDTGFSGTWVGISTLVLAKNDKANLISTVYGRSVAVEQSPSTLFAELLLPLEIEGKFAGFSGSARLVPGMQMVRGTVSFSIDISAKLAVGAGADRCR